MNAVYSILESKYRWLSLAGISFTVGCVGAMMILALAGMLALAWRHEVALVWLYLGLLSTVFFCVRAFLEWKSAAEASLGSTGGARSKRRNSAR